MTHSEIAILRETVPVKVLKVRDNWFRWDATYGDNATHGFTDNYAEAIKAACEAVAINVAVANDHARLGMELAIYNCRQEGVKTDREAALLDEVDRIRRERGIPTDDRLTDSECRVELAKMNERALAVDWIAKGRAGSGVKQVSRGQSRDISSGEYPDWFGS